MVAQYSGDANYTIALSARLTEVVEKPAPTVKLVASANPGKVDATIAFKATVTGSAGTPTGTVTFYSGTSSLGTASLKNGVASLSTDKLTAGKHTIVAKYAGDATYNSASSSVLTEVIEKLVPTVRLASSANPAKAGATVIFKATVTGIGPAPSGAITFKSGTKTLGEVKLSDGKASYSTNKLAAGTYTITASYSGSAVYAAETSAPLKETIDK